MSRFADDYDIATDNPSLANANLVLTLSYLFRNFDMTLKISELKTKDYFGQQVLAPGVPIQFADRAKH